MSVRWKVQKYKIMNLVEEFVPVNAKMRNCFPSLVKPGKKRQISFQCYKLISSKFSNRSTFISELRVLLRKNLGKKKVWHHLSFLGSTKYEKCGANAQCLCRITLSQTLQANLSNKRILPIPLSVEHTLPDTCPHTHGVSAVTGHCLLWSRRPACCSAVLASLQMKNPAISSVLLHKKLFISIGQEEEWCYERAPN